MIEYIPLLMRDWSRFLAEYQPRSERPHGRQNQCILEIEDTA
jgi:hypothetical protein